MATKTPSRSTPRASRAVPYEKKQPLLPLFLEVAVDRSGEYIRSLKYPQIFALTLAATALATGGLGFLIGPAIYQAAWISIGLRAGLGVYNASRNVYLEAKSKRRGVKVRLPLSRTERFTRSLDKWAGRAFVFAGSNYATRLVILAFRTPLEAFLKTPRGSAWANSRVGQFLTYRVMAPLRTYAQVWRNAMLTIGEREASPRSVSRGAHGRLIDFNRSHAVFRVGQELQTSYSGYETDTPSPLIAAPGTRRVHADDKGKRLPLTYRTSLAQIGNVARGIKIAAAQSAAEEFSKDKNLVGLAESVLGYNPASVLSVVTKANEAKGRPLTRTEKQLAAAMQTMVSDPEFNVPRAEVWALIFKSALDSFPEASKGLDFSEGKFGKTQTKIEHVMDNLLGGNFASTKRSPFSSTATRAQSPTLGI